MDQGKIEGPSLVRDDKSFADDSYAPGYLSPSQFLGGGDKRPSGLRLPFASAKIGQKPDNINDWNVDNADAVLGRGRTTRELAMGMQSTKTMNEGFDRISRGI